jgi:HAD superfamily hydrolase (TIGR01484 family)
MRYHVLACDYDGTLAHDGVVDEATVKALKRLRESGRRLIMVTGRELPDLQHVFPHLELFEHVVAENGALLYRPATREEHLLDEPASEKLVQRLRTLGVNPLSVGRVIVATRTPHEVEVLEAIRELGLEHQVIFNKGAVMVLPAGITKATGLAAALRELKLSAHNAVGIGDAENDHHMLALCECGVAVANALPSVKEQADWVTHGARGAGVVELIEKIIASDLAELGAVVLERHALTLGRAGDSDWHVAPYGTNLLLSGTSGSGKSTLATGWLERLSEQTYQYCVIDPEGDYDDVGAIVFGAPDRPPAIEQVIKALEDPDLSCAINLLGIPLTDRPGFFERLFSALLGLRARRGRPHWIVVDEAHHLLPPTQTSSEVLLAPELTGIVWITVHPDHMARAALELVDIVIAVGAAPDDTLKRFATAIGRAAPAVESPLEAGEAIGWEWRTGKPPRRFVSIPPRTERRRHDRKYAKGELPPEHSFYFRGPNGRLNLRAQNLQIFLQSADGVDDDTWLYHLKRGDYSRWLRESIKDDEVADAVARIEETPRPDPKSTRAEIRRLIEERYTAPA